MRIIYPRVKNEFSQEIPLSESLEAWIYYLPSVLTELGLKIYVWGFTGSWLWVGGSPGRQAGWGQLYFIAKLGPRRVSVTVTSQPPRRGLFSREGGNGFGGIMLGTAERTLS